MKTSSPSRVSGRLPLPCALALGLSLAFAAGALAQTPPVSGGTPAQIPVSEGAPPPPPAPVSLEPMVITATRVPTLAEQTAADVTVISREDIEQSQFGDALAALKTVPGLYVADGGMPGQPAGIFLRGTETRQTVILLDGLRLPTGLQRYFDLGYFPLENIERIEVVRGPLGSTQGGGALGGAINFITRRGAADGLTGEADGGYGTFDTQSAALGFSGAKDGVFADASGSYLSTDNRRPNSQFTSSSTLDTVGWQISPVAKLELLGGWMHHDGGSPGMGTPTTATSLDETLEQNLGFLSPSFTVNVGDAWTHTLDYSYARQQSFARQTFFVDDNTTTVRTQGLTYQAEFRPSASVTLQAGAERDWQGVDYVPTNGSTALPFTRDEREDAVFAGAQVQPVPGLTLLGSARHDAYQDFYGSADTWRYGASYRIKATGTVLHASDGTAFEAPEIQNFVDFGFGPSAATLLPERSRGQEIGVTQEAGRWLTLGATAFQSQTTDLVQFDQVTQMSENIGLARMRGIETFADWKLGSAGVLRLDYTNLSAHDEVNDVPLVRRPHNTFSAELRGEVAPGWILGAGVRAADGRVDYDPVTFLLTPQPSYVVARIFAEHEIGKNLRLKLRVENAFNEHYSEEAGFPALPLAVYGSVEWRF